ncbi:MAG: hypothetical protein OXP69_09950 [Spirochaetaceae bacterium]|nr:hypothetical protein [Spirochaetaceae bacterium]
MHERMRTRKRKQSIAARSAPLDGAEAIIRGLANWIGDAMVGGFTLTAGNRSAGFHDGAIMPRPA